MSTLRMLSKCERVNWGDSEIEKMAKKLYVGNLPFNATEEEVRALFAKHGTVLSVNLITDRETGRPGASASWRWRIPPRLWAPSMASR